MNAPHPVGTQKRGRKYDQVLEGARTVFLQDGFEGASVDDIARSAGVSKATLYSYFPDKRLLFLEIAKRECGRQADTALQQIDLEDGPEIVLRAAGHRMLSFALSDLGRGVFRLCVAESDRFPELGQEFYRCGPQLVRSELKHYLQLCSDRGDLRIEDYELAADQFAELCKADMFPRMLMGVSKTFSEREMNRVIDGAVEMFLARYGAHRR